MKIDDWQNELGFRDRLATLLEHRSSGATANSGRRANTVASSEYAEKSNALRDAMHVETKRKLPSPEVSDPPLKPQAAALGRNAHLLFFIVMVCGLCLQKQPRHATQRGRKFTT